ncbi:hypothetical protein [uncultured Bacteroides sp.]|uniref:hypothetical protein n=1 Tax=uncultured Bacteroides sp. TaxID=162156 RepID=UPI002AABD25B|nr:hypothetical protein [uncultured Bacteroides sp.]
MNWDNISSIVAIVFGGTSIWQFLFYRNEKRKKEAEAAALELENQGKEQSLRQNESEFSTEQMKKVTDELNRLQTDYIGLFSTIQSHLRTIGDLQTAVAELKVENTYLRSIRCYKIICESRVRHKKKEEENDYNKTIKNDSSICVDRDNQQNN